MKFRLTKRWIIAVCCSVIIVAMAALVVSTRLASGAQPKMVPISDMLNRAERGELKQATISGDVVTVVTTDDTKLRSIKEANSPLADILRKNGIEVTVAPAEVGFNPTSLIALLPLALIGAVLWFSLRSGGIGNAALSVGRNQPKKVSPNAPTVSFADVAGVHEAKVELAEVVQFLKFPQKFRALGARVPKGVLLVGPPGTGKTLISKAVAGEAGVPFFSMSGSEFVEMFVGVGASRVRGLFREARKNAPCIVFVDEIDAVGRHRTGGVGGNDEREQTLNQLLVEMDGFDGHSNVIVIAATNRPDILDKALLRPGRFDRRVTLDAPDLQGRLAILRVHANGKPLAEDVELETIARLTAGFSGADLANLINEAAILAAREDKNTIGRAEMEESILRVVAGPERKSRIISEDEKVIIAYHEVGHALAMRLVKGGDPVQKVSVISRGHALGITVQTPREDKYLRSRSQLLARMAAAMGGRAAEEIVFGDVTTGAEQDIVYATDIARRMVCDFGMSDLGAISYRRRDEQGGDGLSGEMAARVDEAVNKLVDEARSLALTILTAYRDKLDLIATELQSLETIDGEELDALLQSEPRSLSEWQILAAARSRSSLEAIQS
ncbi:MAG: ATP-dependent zinc metalloprotease FtsH [Chloroflexota bacterium]|nr:MAG: ATP-dependent zinc metalloprotease FtsH [Chloroflexota bacterium]